MELPLLWTKNGQNQQFYIIHLKALDRREMSLQKQYNAFYRNPNYTNNDLIYYWYHTY